jgi:hypothetical protein
MSMAEFVFVDTWAWLALSNKPDISFTFNRRCKTEFH